MIIKLVLWGKCEFNLFYYNAIFKDRVLFRKTQSSIEIDVIVVKKTYVFLNYAQKLVIWKCKKKQVNVIITIIIEYPWICVNVPE